MDHQQLLVKNTTQFSTFKQSVLEKKKNAATICSTNSGFYLMVILLLLSCITNTAYADVHVVHIDLQRSPTFTTNQRFLSVALGASMIAENFKNFDLADPRLQKLLLPLSPGYLRIGGTMANRLTFVPKVQFQPFEEDKGDDCFYEGRNCDKSLDKDFTMTGDQWLDINGLASKSGMKVLFDINVIPRLSNGSWDSSNAEKLIEFSNRHNLNVIWELGNEPTLLKNHFGFEINPFQLAADFTKLRSILDRYPLYKDAFLVGPDMAQPKPRNLKFFKYLEDFLRSGSNAIDAITWHQYNLNGNTAKHADFLNPDVLDELKNQITRILDTVKAAGVNNKRIWLGETANAYGGGAPGISDRFIASFLWLDKLGVAAQYGIDVVMRQTLFRSHYAIVDQDLTPLPDWWVSAIYKQLVGTKVVTCSNENSKFVRLYCHCTKNKALDINAPSITVFGMNLKNTEERVQLHGVPLIHENVYAYVLTGDPNLLSKRIHLNNEPLQLHANWDLPRVRPRIVKAQPFLVMPPFSLVFWVVPSPAFKFC